MIEIIKFSQTSQMPWKNGKGTTRQLAIFPPEADLSVNPFLWRLSSARITQKDPFSQFLGHNRILIIWKGNGVELNSKPLFCDTPYCFQGEDIVYANPINGPVIDIGLIFHRNHISASVEIIEEKTGTFQLLLEEENLYFLFYAKGEIAFVNSEEFCVGDTLKIEKEKSVEIESKNESTIYLFSIKNIN